jgi:hypothetical protein
VECEQYDDPHKAAALKHYVKWNLTVGQELRESLGDMRCPPQVVALVTSAVESIQEDEKGNEAWILRSKTRCGLSMP